MMHDMITALFRSIVPIFVMVMMGLGIRRMGWVGGRGTDGLSRVVIYFFFPTLVFHRLATTAEPSALISDWVIHVWAVIVLLGSGVLGFLWHRGTRSGADLRTFVFMVGMPNWIYLPLALAGPMWGDEAVRLLILFNIPTQVILWTVGIWLLHGTLRGAHVIKFIVLNPGFLSTAAGLLVAFSIVPVTLLPDRSGLSLVFLSQPLHVLGNLTVPLSLVALGLYLGERSEADRDDWRDIGLVTVGRVLLAPLCLSGLVLASAWTPMGANTLVRWLVYLIIAMPVAVSAPMFAQMFGRDRFLASRGVVITTLVSFITAPIFLVLMIRIESWLGLDPLTLTIP